MMYGHPDDEPGELATPMASVREWAWQAGQDQLDRAWLLHDYDVWVANPHYTGPAVPHPEHEYEPQPGGVVVRAGEPDDDIPF